MWCESIQKIIQLSFQYQKQMVDPDRVKPFDPRDIESAFSVGLHYAVLVLSQSDPEFETRRLVFHGLGAFDL